MPIRFDSGGGGGGNSNNSGGGNNKGAMAILLLIVFFVFRKPKIAIPILIIGAILFFMFAPKDSFADEEIQDSGEFAKGCSIDQDIYDKAEVFEPLAAGSDKYSIPKAVSLRKYAPTRRNQGQQGSCVGWASAYAARTIVEAVATGKSPNQVAFSPSFLYNQIAIPGCQGSYTSEALKKMKNDGTLFFSKFPYDEDECSTKPSNSQLREAQRYKIRGYNRLSVGGSNYDVDLEAVKQNIAQGAPVIIAMKVPESFYYVDDELWDPGSRDRRGMNRMGGHAMCAIGYDENKFGGAFEVMNSWGRNWGDDGVFWIKYDDFQDFVREAYGLYPHPKAKTSSTDKFEVEFGLVDSRSGRNIPLRQKRDNLFETKRPIKIDSKFKIEVTNSIECFTYVFGQETDGSSYVLFPYTKKHSPYCGIVGTRHFPKGDENLRADDIGDRDYMAIVVSKEELDYENLNNKINRVAGKDYLTKLNNALGSMQLSNTKFKDGATVAFQGKTKGNQKVVGVVLAIDKE